jgi:hypothetical protein
MAAFIDGTAFIVDQHRVLKIKPIRSPAVSQARVATRLRELLMKRELPKSQALVPLKLGKIAENTILCPVGADGVVLIKPGVAEPGALVFFSAVGARVEVALGGHAVHYVLPAKGGTLCAINAVSGVVVLLKNFTHAPKELAGVIYNNNSSG